MLLRRSVSILFAAVLLLVLAPAASQAGPAIELSATVAEAMRLQAQQVGQTASVQVAEAEVADIAGTYSVRGTNPSGSSYKGKCVITSLGDGLYEFEWYVGNHFVGTGELDGDRISVDWGADDPVIYRVMADGSLRGTWADGAATETLKPMR